MIYFIRSKRRIKIGYAKNPESRLLQLQTGNPEKLKLVATMVGDKNTEATLHHIYKKKRFQGEWFYYGGALKASVMALSSGYPAKTVREFQRIGDELRIRQRANRRAKRGNNDLKLRIRSA